ncbi:hypothetical protein OROHE_001798 [Orobanche hederae]
MADTDRVGEIEEEEEATPLLQNSNESDLIQQRTRTVTTKVPEAEVHVYRQGKGPIDVIKTGLTGWDQDQLEVREILDKYGFKSLYAFTPDSGRGVPIRFNPRNGRSLITYRDGAIIYVDGEPKWETDLLLGHGSGCPAPLHIVSTMKAIKLMKKGCSEAFMASIVSTEPAEQGIENISVVNEYQDVLREVISGIPTVRRVEFTIE